MLDLTDEQIRKEILDIPHDERFTIDFRPYNDEEEKHIWKILDDLKKDGYILFDSMGLDFVKGSNTVMTRVSETYIRTEKTEEKK